MMETLGIDEDTPIDQKILSGAIENAQKRVESRNFQMRKNVLEYDDVMNLQRTIIYEQRRKVLDGEDIHESIQNMLENVMRQAITAHGRRKRPHHRRGDPPRHHRADGERYFAKGAIDCSNLDAQQVADRVVALAKETYARKEAAFTAPVMRELERVIPPARG